MHKEITHNLPPKLKLLLGYRGLPTFFVLFFIFLSIVFSFSMFYNYFKLKPTDKLPTQSTLNLNSESTNLAHQIHLHEIEDLKKDNVNKNIPPYFSLLSLLIPLYILRSHHKRGKEIYEIIQNGVITKGNLINIIIISDKSPQLYKIDFKFYSDIDNKTEYILTIKTHFEQKFEDEIEELIIFDKANPNNSFLVDSLSEYVANHIKKNWIT